METIPDKVVKFKRGKGGLNLVSMVDAPAIGFVAIKFSEQQEFKLSVQDEEKRIIFTPVLIPDQKIYREIKGEKFNLIFEKDTIEEVAIQFAEDGLAIKADVNHSRQLVDGVVWFESFILSKDRAPLAKGFEQIPEGTWFLTGKVYNDQVWADIKAGKIQGVSIDGLFQAEDAEDQLASQLKALFDKNGAEKQPV